MRIWIYLGVALVSVVGTSASATDVPFEPSRWVVDAAEHQFEEYRGQRALRLDRGVATAKDVQLLDGVIEFDIALSDARGFSGVLWRVLDSENHEEFYLRHHLSGQPDASQYTPVFNGLRGWQLYTGPQDAAPVLFEPHEWVHVKLVISSRQADIYVDSNEPVLHIPELRRPPQSGGLAFKSTFSPAWFSNLTVRPLEGAEILGQPVHDSAPPDHLITQWSVSRPFPRSEVAGELTLDNLAAEMEWTELQSEANGLINIARVARHADGNDTVFVRVRLRAARAQKMLLRFGFSDEVHVFLNGELLFVGSDGFQSRDYKFMGTVGLFDAVVLPLKEGDNELRFAVSEVFGGWGLMAQMDEASGVEWAP